MYVYTMEVALQIMGFEGDLTRVTDSRTKTLAFYIFKSHLDKTLRDQLTEVQ